MAFTGESQMLSWQVLSSDFSVSPPRFVDMSWSLQYDTLMSLMTCCYCRPPRWLLLGDSAAVSCLVSPQSPGEHEQMKQVRGSPSKTGCAQTHYYYTLSDKRSPSQSQWDSSSGRKSSFAANASRWNVIMNTTVSHLLSTTTVGFLFFKLVRWSLSFDDQFLGSLSYWWCLQGALQSSSSAFSHECETSNWLGYFCPSLYILQTQYTNHILTRTHTHPRHVPAFGLRFEHFLFPSRSCFKCLAI